MLVLCAKKPSLAESLRLRRVIEESAKKLTRRKELKARTGLPLTVGELCKISQGVGVFMVLHKTYKGRPWFEVLGNFGKPPCK